MEPATEERAAETTDIDEETKQAQEAEAKLIRQIEAEHDLYKEHTTTWRAKQLRGSE